MTDLNIKEEIRDCISSFISTATDSIEFLTEEDVRCRLFCYLKDNLSKLIQDEKISIHAEVRWYGARELYEEPLSCRSDLVIIDQDSLSEGNKYVITPSKGFGFDEYYAVIELKLRRFEVDSDGVFLNKINQDLEKLLEIKRVTPSIHCPYYFLLIFDKTNDLTSQLPESEEVMVYYKHFNVSL